MPLLFQDSVDTILIIGAVLSSITILLFCKTTWSHYKRQYSAHVQRVSLRVAMVVPIYSFFMVLALAYPNAYAFFEIPVALYEAYAIYSYFAMLVLYCQGPEKVIELLKTKSIGCWTRCAQSSPEKCYKVVDWSMFQFMFTHTFFIIAMAIAEHHHRDAALARALNLIVLVWAMIALLFIYRALHDETAKMQATGKILLIKGIILILALQKILLDSLYSSGVFETDAGLDKYDPEQKKRRMFAFVAICEFLLGAFLVERTFQADDFSDKDWSLDSAGDDVLVPRTNLTFYEFMYHLLSFNKIFTEPVVKGTSKSGIELSGVMVSSSRGANVL